MPTPRKIEVLLLSESDCQANSAEVESLLANDSRLHVTLQTATATRASSAAKHLHPDIVLLDGFAADAVTDLDEVLPETPILVLLSSTEQGLVQPCVAAGARGCLLRPFDPEALAATIVQVHERANRLRQLSATPTRGQLIAVRGAKGGIGTTAIATNLAVTLHRQTRQPTVLVDGNFCGGDIPAALSLAPHRSVMDLLSNLDRLDEDILTTTLVHHSSGVHVLAAPTEFEQVELIHADAYQRVLEELRARFAHVVVDCSTFIDPNTLVAFDIADLLLLVTTPELASLKNTTRVLQLGARLGYSERKMRLVVNRYNLSGAVSAADFEQHLAYHTSFKFPNDPAVSHAFASGEPLKPSSGMGRALDKLARTVVGDAGWQDEPRQQRRPWRVFSRSAAAV
jgi:pilus assembly protein CpaE